MAALLHQQWDATGLPPPQGVEGLGGWLSLVLPTGAALALLLRPGSSRRLALLCAVQLADVLWWLPVVSNHYTLMGLADATWLTAAGLRALRERRFPDAAAVLEDARPFLRLLVIVLYAFAFFWKLNPDFVDPQTSCAVTFYRNIESLHPILPDAASVGGLVVAATLLVEALLPVLLVWRRTRAPALVLAGAFHYGLALDAIQGFLNFSSAMFALLLLFAPKDAGAILEARAGAWLDRGRWLGPVLVTATGVLIALALRAPPDALVYSVGRRAFWLVYGLVGIACALAWMRARGVAQEPFWPRRASLLWIFPLLALANGCAPLLGVKTRSSWQMYSNLRLEARASNHLWVPRSLDLFGVLGDAVRVIETDDPGRLGTLAAQGLDLTWHDFRLYTSRAPEISVLYERGGRRYRVARAGDDPALSTPPGGLARKVFWFRPLGPGVATRCDW